MSKNGTTWQQPCEQPTVHVGRIFEICVEKGAELNKGDPGRKFKGRVVYQGNNVKDENYDMASHVLGLLISSFFDGGGKSH